MTGQARGLRVFASMALVMMTGVALVSCGGGGGGGGGSEPAGIGGGDQMTIMPPTDNRTPVVVQTFADITITLEDGGPDRWASGDLGTNFSDPDGDPLSYSVGSSNESVAGAVISEPGPSVIVQAQGGGGATITITATDPGGLAVTQSFRVTVNDRPDHSDTPAGATAIALSENFRGRIDSPNDVDYFRLRVDVPGTLTIRTTGNADPDIAVFDGAGNEVPGVSGSWIGSITQDILDRGHDLLVRFSGGNAGEGYTGSTTLGQRSETSPDLSVGLPTVSDSGPETGGAFTLSATVTNNTGDGESAATTLRYYRSTDATITTSDTTVGTELVAGLAASGSISSSVDLTAPSTAGTYYYGACVDTVTDESNTTNNCSSSVQVTVSQPVYPDLEVGSPSVSNSGPVVGASFTLSLTVRNAGGGESPATTLRYYRSTDATITSSDTEVGTEAVGTLSASGSSSGSVDLTAPASPGTHYYGACVDAVTDESDTTDNCSSSVEVTVLVTEPQLQGQPDLGVGTPTVSNSAPETGTSFTLSATVSNTGDGESPATTLRYYRSTDATITTSDTSVGTDAVGALAAAGTSAESILLTAPATAGAYYYGACVDAVADESDTTDNCSASVPVTVPEPEPDLVVGSPTVSDSSPAPGASFTLSATVRNAGGAASSSTTLRYYRSTDATITTSDTSVGTDAVGALAAAGTSSESISLTVPATAGTYYYGGCVDAVPRESDTANNCSASVQVTVSEPTAQTAPDLVVRTPTVSDASVETGGMFTLSATVSNDGDGESAATTLRYYWSTDQMVTTTHTEVGTDDVGALTASGTSEESISLTARWSQGRYFYGACVDAVADESDTTNNCSAPATVTVEPPQQPEGLPSVRLSRVSSSVTEGMSARITVIATPPPTADLVVNLTYVEYTKTESEIIYHNWPPTETTVTITGGSSSTTLTVGTIDDSDVDGNSALQVWVSSGIGYTPDPSNARFAFVEVVDDD